MRALDRDDNTAAPVAYLEAAPRIWIQVGYTHPLLNQIQAPNNSALNIAMNGKPNPMLRTRDIPTYLASR